ncbi:MAG: rhomboid family intramembrane serine protease [Propionibacteriaceae bacterium]
MTETGSMTCYRHEGVAAGIVCTRCKRPICPACMVDAAVGFQCPECTRQGARETRQGLLPYGGYPSRDPRLTSIVLIVVNVVVWLLASRGSLGDHLGLAPRGVCLAANDPTSYYPGALQAACTANGGAWVAGVSSGAWWQVVTSVFTHLTFVHLAVNMVSLFVIGPIIERVLGRTRFLVLYGISGLAGSASVMWLTSPDASTVGASGALFGLMGALLLLSYKAKGNFVQVLVVLGANVAFTLFYVGTISWQGHFGGLAGGLVAAWVIAYAPRERRRQVQVYGLAALTILILAAIVAKALMLG